MKNKYFYYTWTCISHYTRRCTIKIFIVHGSVFLIMQDDV